MDFEIRQWIINLVTITYPGYPLNYLFDLIQSIDDIIHETYQSIINLRKNGYDQINWFDNHDMITNYIMNILDKTLSGYLDTHTRNAIMATEQGTQIFKFINNLMLWLFQQAGIKVIY